MTRSSRFALPCLYFASIMLLVSPLRAQTTSFLPDAPSATAPISSSSLSAADDQ